MMGKKSDKAAQPGVFKRTVAAAEAIAGGEMERGDDFALYRYPDYETYRAVQTKGNKAKLKRQFVKESHIELLAKFLNQTLGATTFGLCHGTRRGAEQAWFTKHLAGAPEVIGTEISDTADQFPNTVQWDFHETRDNWVGRADFVYSNSWDHAFDPVRAFSAWIGQLRPGGVLLLDHTRGQMPDASNALDPFGVSFERLQEMLAANFLAQGGFLPVIDARKSNPDYRARVVVFRKNG
ncbi:class I SAM-dependent methyltransferase [Tabrizicola sp. J26]|uniref:class I SAM-dependent methyltransferase n=1 Tax=Alitabrizicola rongguiensis TaxID=2909234 RepID=UPI001F45D5DB|nr:class I SAM-dependent methyltransferase [Tabrizicola rongguiensis]MCF1708518.1 class I SAM-dependent methyltransferase [Tabrizicola rongguiensis]